MTLILIELPDMQRDTLEHYVNAMLAQVDSIPDGVDAFMSEVVAPLDDPDA